MLNTIVFDMDTFIMEGHIDQISPHSSATIPADLHKSVTVTRFVEHYVQPNIAVRGPQFGVA